MWSWIAGTDSNYRPPLGPKMKGGGHARPDHFGALPSSERGTVRLKTPMGEGEEDGEERTDQHATDQRGDRQAVHRGRDHRPGVRAQGSDGGSGSPGRSWSGPGQGRSGREDVEGE